MADVQAGPGSVGDGVNGSSWSISSSACSSVDDTHVLLLVAFIFSNMSTSLSVSSSRDLRACVRILMHLAL